MVTWLCSLLHELKLKNIDAIFSFIVHLQLYHALVQTVLINFFDNACYWIKESKNKDQRIIVNAEMLQDDRVTITISDTGLGVPEENAEKIFIPGVTGKPKGIGMGLVIVTELVSAYKGKVGLKIPGDLHGASFVFDLPIKRW